MSIERNAAWPDQSPQLSAANRNRERPDIDRAMEGRSANSDNIYNIARRNALDILLRNGSRTTFSFELFTGPAAQRRGSDHGGSSKPACARSRAQSCD